MSHDTPAHHRCLRGVSPTSTCSEGSTGLKLMKRVWLAPGCLDFFSSLGRCEASVSDIQAHHLALHSVPWRERQPKLVGGPVATATSDIPHPRPRARLQFPCGSSLMELQHQWFVVSSASCQRADNTHPRKGSQRSLSACRPGDLVPHCASSSLACRSLS